MTRADLPAWSEPFHRSPDPASELPPDGRITRQWAFGDGSGRGVRVAVIDSGIDASHPAVGHVAEYVAISLDADAPDGVRIETDPHDDLYGHGTACAALIRSLAPDAELVSVRVLGTNLKGSALAFAHGLNWCLENRVVVANLSLSTTNESYKETFYDLIDAAAFSRMLVVSAMANERKTSIPSEFAGVFSVAAGPGTDPDTFWFNPQGPADWGAPGIDVDVAWTGGATIRATGNSFAAPVISGQLARMMAAHPDLTPWQARTVLAAVASNSRG